MGHHCIKMPFETNIQIGHFVTLVFQSVHNVSGVCVVCALCMQKLNNDYYNQVGRRFNQRKTKTKEKQSRIANKSSMNIHETLKLQIPNFKQKMVMVAYKAVCPLFFFFLIYFDTLLLRHSIQFEMNHLRPLSFCTNWIEFIIDCCQLKRYQCYHAMAVSGFWIQLLFLNTHQHFL